MNKEGSYFNLDFLASETAPVVKPKGSYKVIIADDDKEIHMITKMILKTLDFEGKDLVFIDAYSGEEAKRVLVQNPDAAILILDVVMESNMSGLEVVDFLRNTLKNKFTRIILRTGQPGEAPEDKIIRNYDINDYLLKTDMTVQRLHTSIYSSLRSYRDMVTIDRNRQGLEKIIQASSEMFKHHSLTEFLSSILNQISSFYEDQPDMIFLRENENNVSGFICVDNKMELKILAAKGKYEKFIGQKIDTIEEFKELFQWIKEDDDTRSRVAVVDNGLILKKSGNNMITNYIFIEDTHKEYKLDLIELFLTNYSMALDIFYLEKLTRETQQEVLYTLGEVIETHSEETAGHLKRITNMMYAFGQKLGFSYAEAEFVRIASALHDVGKIGIPDFVLKKPGKLTDEEMTIMKTHAEIGYTILKKSNLEVLQIAADIALHHHEKYDGSGYPHGLKGDEISLNARMLAIIDVFDAMTHKRVYKKAISKEETLEYITAQKGKHFDPFLVELFLQNLDELLEAQEGGSLHRDAERAITRDKLTRLDNRVYLESIIEEEMEKVERSGEDISLVLINLDHFKRLNDRLGRQVGDEVLKLTAEIASANVRERDRLVRFGGSEFAILMPRTNLREALAVAEKIRKALESTPHPEAGRFTASMGVAERKKAEPYHEWLQRTLQAIYRAKENGRNLVISAEKRSTGQPVDYIAWKKIWESGNTLIDRQHQELLEMTNVLIYMTKGQVEQWEIAVQLNRLLTFNIRHFEDEERILQEIGYPQLEEHTSLHKKLTLKARELELALLKGDIALSTFFSFLVDDVVMGHILNEDLKYHPYFQERQ